MATVARAALSLGRGRCGVARQSRGWARHCAGFVHPLPSLGEDEKTEHGFDEGRALPRTGSASMIHRSVPPRRAPKSSVAAEEPSPRMMAAVRTLLEEVGEDPGRGGLQRTPYRYAKALKALTQGYGMSLEGAHWPPQPSATWRRSPGPNRRSIAPRFLTRRDARRRRGERRQV